MQAYNQLGRPDLAKYVEGGKKFQRLYGPLDGSYQPLGTINAARRAFLGQPDGIKQPMNDEEWIRQAVDRYKGDVGLQELLSKQV